MSSPAAGAPETPTDDRLAVLAAVERRVLWLATRIIDYANRERPSDDDLKVGGHQASSASLVSLMTALYLHDLSAADRVSVKPHASPVLHALSYLLGRLERSHLTTLREFGGLQAYPSRTKDVFPVDYSTGSVGLGAAAPLFGALADRYVQEHFGSGTGGRFIALMGDAELDEGNVWEAVLEPATAQLGNTLWIVDLNRQSLDRVVPGIKSVALQREFDAAGWRVLELKYGRRLRAAYAESGGEVLRRRIDEMPNQRYQSLFGASEEVIREALLSDLSNGDRRALGRLLRAHDGEIAALIQDLGGHDLGDILDALAQTHAGDRPTVLFAYTIKGFGLPIAGRPLNHSAHLSGEQIDALRAALGLSEDDEWDAFAPDSPEGALCAAAQARLERAPHAPRTLAQVPATLSGRDARRVSTQDALGRALLDLSRVEGVGERVVTVSPDVSVSTNLGGWINKVGVFATAEEPDWGGVEESPLSWVVSPRGQHIELGISEMNLFLMLGQLGMTHEMQGEPLLPVGTVYDPFVCRGLDGLIYSVYSGARFVIAGTPSGISLAREGGAHQSTVTPGLGIELPALTYAEPAYGRECEWLLLDGLRRLHEPDGEALYLRLSTTPVEQAPFTAAVEREGAEALREAVLAGAYWLHAPGPETSVLFATCGAIVPQVLGAAELLADEEGIGAAVLCISSADRLYRGWREARLAPLADVCAPRGESHLERLVPPAMRGLALVTAIDGASHSLAFLGGCLGMPAIPLGVDRFGQSGSQPALYREHDLSPDAIAAAALVALGA